MSTTAGLVTIVTPTAGPKMISRFLIAGIFFFGTASLWGQTSHPQERTELVRRVGEVKYISQQSYYVNLGKKHGISAGDTLLVKRNGQVIGKLVVENLANLSASCRLLFQNPTVRQGDVVETFVLIEIPEPGIRESVVPRSRSQEQAISRRKSGSTSTTSGKKSSNRIKGRIGVQSVWFDDRSGSNLDHSELSIHSRLEVEQFLGLPWEFRARWRSRGLHRDRAVSSSVSRNEWRHRAYELALVYGDDDSPYEFGFGRVQSNRIRGLGYIDGGLFSVKLNDLWRVGLAAGTQPGLRTSAFQTQEQKVGVFLNFEKGDYQRQRFLSTVAFSGCYHLGEVSREFVYLQNNFSAGSQFSIYQTVEADLNRGWKTDLGNGSVQFSNFFLSSRYSPSDFISFNISYDARKTIRIYETRSIPDSLFDETTRRGLHSGISLRLTPRIRLSGNFGIRFREGERSNTTSATGSLSLRQIFNTTATLDARVSYFSAQFTNGYRPSASLRIPVLRKLSFNFGAGSYIYQTGSRTTKNNWLEAYGYYHISRRFYANFGYRTFFDKRLESNRIFLETGIVF